MQGTGLRNPVKFCLWNLESENFFLWNPESWLEYSSRNPESR